MALTAAARVSPQAPGTQAPPAVLIAAQAGECRVRMPIGRSQAIRDVAALIHLVAGHDSTVLLRGESGSGKEVAARAIHDLSPRRARPFVAVNCGAIPAELLESELFGHEKGSFTGAVYARKGRFEIAEGGTLFLDEIGDMSPAMQVKLLRVLQERVFERVGNHVPTRCNVRIIAATHRNLEEAITREGGFREDLYHRLNVFPIEMPPLRERIEDLPLLVEDFIARNASEGRGRIRLAPRAVATLARYPWPGNVRELGNLIERLSIVRANGLVEPADLPPKYRAAEGLEAFAAAGAEATEPAEAACDGGLTLPDAEVLRLLEPETREAAAPAVPAAPAVAAADPVHALSVLPPEGIDLRSHLLAIERRLIEQALERFRGTVAHAARALGLRRTTLVEKLRKHGIAGDDCATED
jgi:sigma-54 dependent transcriptional regulator, flagellar regulatory protein